MPIVIKAQGKDSTHDVIKKFKKAVVASGIVQIAKDKRYFIKPSKTRADKKIEMKRLKKRARSLKRMKNVSPLVLQRIGERIAK